MIFSFITVLLTLIQTASAPAARPWDVPFSPNASGIALAARNVTRSGNPDVIVLLETHRFTVDADGRSDHTLRKVYRILSEDALEDWATITQSYQPWYQQTPVVRARVIGPDGSVRTLDLKTIADAPTLQFDSTIFSDDREIRAPLPNVVKDSVIEYEITIHEKMPMLDAGVVHDIRINDFVPVERFHFEIDADAKASVKVSSRSLPADAIKQTAAGRRAHIEADFGPLDTREEYISNLPSDEPQLPWVGFSTGQSWQAIAARYDSIVNQRIAGADVKAMLGDTNLTGPPQEIAAKLTAILHQKVRYTGIEFGEAAIIPGSPTQTIQRGYGDCKDKSALLVAMLRAAGLPANIALLQSGFASDINRTMPGMGAFDHAIVYVGTNPPMWIDATAESFRVPTLPTADQGRLALIAAAQTKDLVRTPESEAKDNWRHHDIEIRMKDLGYGSIRETMRAGGSLEAESRHNFDGTDTKVRELLESYVKEGLSAKSLGPFQLTPKADMSESFQVSVQALESRQVNTTLEDAAVALQPSLIFDPLPAALVKEGSKRTRDFVFSNPFQVEMRIHIFPPALFEIVDMPKSQQSKIGTASIKKSYEKSSDGSIEVVYAFDSGKRRLTAEEFEAYKAAVDDQIRSGPDVLSFVLKTNESVATGEVSKAISLMRTAIAEKPNDAMMHVRFARVLLSAGLGGPALVEAKKAIEIAPDSSVAWQVLAWVYQHDTFGRRMLGGWNPAEAEKGYRKAIELDGDPTARMDLAILLEHNKNGWRYAADARLNEAIALYRELLKDKAYDVVSTNLVVALLRVGDFEGAKQETKKLPQDSRVRLEAILTAIQDGPARALVSLQSAYPDPQQRQLALMGASASLMQLRKYDLAQAMINAAVRLGSSPELRNRADLIAKLKPAESLALPKDDPRSAVQQLFATFFSGTFSVEAFRVLFSNRLDTGNAPDAEIEDLSNEMSEVQAVFSVLGFEAEGLSDFIMSLMQFEKDGDDAHGYRISASIVGSEAPPMYVIREDDTYRIIGIGPDGYDGIAKLVLELLDHGKVKDAQWWLDKVRDDIKDEDGFGVTAFRGIWSGVTEAGRGDASIRKAAAVLLAMSGDDAGVRSLEPLRAKETRALEKAQIDKAIAESQAKSKKWPELMATAKRLGSSATKLYVDAAFQYLIKAAVGSGNWKELDAAAQEKLKTDAMNGGAIRAQMMAKAALGDDTAAAAAAKKLTESKSVSLQDHTLVAWTKVASGTVDSSILDKLKEIAPKSGLRSSASGLQYVLPLVKLRLNMTDEGQQEFVRLLARSNEARLSPIAWIIYGKICQQYGFESEYQKAMERARSARHESDPDSQWALFMLNR